MVLLDIMKLTTKGRYAVMAMADLAANQNGKPVSLNDISLRQNISLSYLEQLFSLLRKGNLVKGVRGPGGGYSLSMKPNDITIAQILSAINRFNPNCDPAKPDEVIWAKFSNTLNNYLATITFQVTVLFDD